MQVDGTKVPVDVPWPSELRCFGSQVASVVLIAWEC